MFFQKKLDRAQKWLQEKGEKDQELPLEKGDLPLMILLGMGIILPVCLLVLLAICSFVFFL